MAQGHRPSRRGVPGGGQAGPAYLAARLGSEPSGLFGFFSLCPNSSDGLDKMFLTAYEMDSWPPPGARRVARADREAELSLQGSRGSRPACPPASCQRPTRLPTSFKSFQVKSELSSGHRTWPCILGRLVFFILLGREALPGGGAGSGAKPRLDWAHPQEGPSLCTPWSQEQLFVGRGKELGFGARASMGHSPGPAHQHRSHPLLPWAFYLGPRGTVTLLPGQEWGVQLGGAGRGPGGALPRPWGFVSVTGSC